MKKRLIRFLCCLTAMTVFCVPALAALNDHAFSFTLSAEMNADAYPEDERQIVSGIADLINMMTIEGKADIMYNAPNCFDTSFDLLLNGNEKTRTSFRLFGRDSHWSLESSLLGSESVLINHLALAEFATKTFFHLDLAVGPIVIALSPYTTTVALEWITQEWTKVFGGEGTRTIDRETVLAFADYISQNATTNSYFKYWISCLFLQMGYSDDIIDAFGTVYEWADQFLSVDGITITCEGETEIWKSGARTLFTRNGNSWEVTLPVSVDGYRMTLSCESDGVASAYQLLWKNKRGEKLLLATAEWSMLPEYLPFAGEIDFRFSLSGQMPGEPVSYHWTISSDGESFSAVQENVETGETMLTLRGTWQETATAHPRYAEEQVGGMNFLSVDDNSLPAFIKSVTSPLLKGMLPILVETPASTYQSIFTFLENYGILGLLTSGL